MSKEKSFADLCAELEAMAKRVREAGPADMRIAELEAEVEKLKDSLQQAEER
jgi:cell division protein FtsB